MGPNFGILFAGIYVGALHSYHDNMTREKCSEIILTFPFLTINWDEYKNAVSLPSTQNCFMHYGVILVRPQKQCSWLSKSKFTKINLCI